MDPSQDMSTLSPRSLHVLIATCTIGGVIVVAFIVYVVIRVCKGAALVDVLKLRRVASPLATTAKGDVNDLSIQWEQRYSVHSSHYPSRRQTMNLSSRRQRDVPPLPLPVTQRFSSKDAYYRWYWKHKAQPTTPVDAIQSWFMKDATPSPTTQKPDMVHLKANRASVGTSRSTVRYSAATFKSSNSQRLSKETKAPSVSVRSVTDAESVPAGTRNLRFARLSWSTTWTDASAPPTPKIKLDMKRSSTESGSKYRPVTAWTNPQMESINEDTNTPLASCDNLPIQKESPEKPQSGGMRTFFR